MRIYDISFAGQSLHPYSLRIDLPHPDNTTFNFPDMYETNPFFDEAYNWIRLHFKYAIVAFERSDAGKPHLQCFCLHSRSYTNKELLKFRAHVKAKIATQDTKQPVSIKKSFSPLGLFTYCQKDGNIRILMPDALFKHLVILAEAGIRRPREQVLHTAVKQASSLRNFVRLLLQQVELGALTCVPRKREVWKLAVRFHLIDFDTFYAEFYSPRQF